MARVLNKATGKVVEKYNDLTRDTSGVLTGPLNKLWRARILLNRAIPTLPKDDALKGKAYDPNGVLGESQISSKNPILNKQLQAKWRMELQFPRMEEGEGIDPAKGNKNTTNYRNFEVKADIRYQNEVRIYICLPTQFNILLYRTDLQNWILEEKLHGQPLNPWDVIHQCITLLVPKILFNLMYLGTAMTQRIQKR